MTTTLDAMYGISKDGAAPYVYFSHDPQDRHGTDYGYRLLAVNQRQQPAASFAIVGPFTDQDRERHLADPASWDGGRWELVATEPDTPPCGVCGGWSPSVETWTRKNSAGDFEYRCDGCIHEVRDYSDAIDRLIGGLSAMWRMPDA